MNLPSGLVFYLDFKYGTAIQGRATTDSLAGTTGPNSPSGSSAPFGTKGLYGAGQFGYTVSQSTVNGYVIDAGALPSFEDINFDADISASTAGTLVKITSAEPASVS